MKSLKNNKGQALVEFAIIIPILFLLIMGILQFGMMLNSYLTIENASREGAREGIAGSSDADIRSRILAVTPNLDHNDLTITITPDENSRSAGDTLTVTVTYNYKLTVPIISTIFHNAVNINGQTSMRVE